MSSAFKPVDLKIPMPYPCTVYMFGIDPYEGHDEMIKTSNTLGKKMHRSPQEIYAALQGMESTYMMVTGWHEDKVIGLGVNVPSIQDLEYSDVASIIAHESYHIVKSLEQAVYFDGQIFDEETTAYLIQCIMLKALKQLFKWQEINEEK